MFHKIRIAALSALLGLGTLAGAPATAQADGIYFSFGSKGPGAGVHNRDRGRYHRQHRPRMQHSCRPAEALRKALHMGLRHPRVVQTSRNTIHVAGLRHRHRASIVFARTPHCPVIRAL